MRRANWSSWLVLWVVNALVLTVGFALCGCSQSPREENGVCGRKQNRRRHLLEMPAKPETSSAEAEPAETKQAEKSATAGRKLRWGLPPLPVPDDNPMTPEKVELGKLLYFDTRVSKDGTISCATCHDPKMAWAEHTPTSDGIGHQKGARNAPTVINAAYATSQFWDGRAKTLEDQAIGPVENPIEMGHTMEGRGRRPLQDSRIPGAVQEGFRHGRYQGGFCQGDCRLRADRPQRRFALRSLRAGRPERAERRSEARLGDCFATTVRPATRQPLFSNYRFFNAGVGMDKPNADEGRKKVTGKDSDRGKFRVPALRNVADTAPYFHDGSAAKLEDAVALMAGGGKDNPNLSEMLKSVREANLGAKEQKDLVEFLKALSGKYPVIEPPALPK